MQRLYAVLKCIVAFFSVTTGIILVISVARLVFFTDNMRQLGEVAGGRFAGILVLLIFLGLAYLMCWLGYRLFMRIWVSGALARKQPLSTGFRKFLGILYLLIGPTLLLSVLGNLGRNLSNTPGITPEESDLRFWILQALVGAGAFFLIRIGYGMLKPLTGVKEKKIITG
ncbi:MAG: hypothetical protein J7623_03025 [Chitinophaga sp.]|uniref:hypothetical protein n=1 Tax=Chitinophaga sp. TaxID=1869181 RepID=UPI001B04D7BC|nr:hypothetical protein [Chitinophaga sp.]MBO9727591.1 hypothetical protein [Chitinophaga sp.]